MRWSHRTLRRVTLYSETVVWNRYRILGRKRDLTGGVAVVTGAGSGLGRALAQRLADAGMKIAVADLAEEAAERVAAEISRDGAGVARPFVVDAGEESSIRDLASRVEHELGVCQVLCSNVGVQQFGTGEELLRGDWEWVFRVNVLGAVSLAQVFLPQLRAAEGARRILFTSSTTALFPVSHMPAYVASKAALLALADTLRVELEPDEIGVSTLLPGPMRTTHLQSSETAKPEGSGTPVYTRETIEVVAAATAGEMVEPDYAARNVVEDLLANHAHIVTHDVHRDLVRERARDIESAFDRARR